jgi:hypothetical protein
VLGSKFGHFLDVLVQTKSVGDYFSRLARSKKRARDYGIDGYFQTAQPLSSSTHALNPFWGERPLVVGPGSFGGSGYSVAH